MTPARPQSEVEHVVRPLDPSASTPPHDLLAVFVLNVALVATLTVVPSTSSAGVVADDPGVIADWNAVAVATIVIDAGKANAEAFMWYAYTQAAVYNAVVGITRRYELYKWSHLGPAGASPEAAAAVAAHDVLLEYFPASATRLSDALALSLGAIPDGSSKDAGIAYGEQAAAAHHPAARR